MIQSFASQSGLASPLAVIEGKAKLSLAVHGSLLGVRVKGGGINGLGLWLGFLESTGRRLHGFLYFFVRDAISTIWMPFR